MIPPGGEGQIKVTLHPKGKAVQISKRVVVHTNDPDQPEFGLTMKGRLLYDLMAVPSSLRMADLKQGEKATIQFELQLAEDGGATIESVTLADTEHFSLRRIDDPKGEPGGKANPLLQRYEIAFNGAGKFGRNATTIKVVTTGKHTPQLSIPVQANVEKNLRYLKSLTFVRQNGKLQEREIHISARHGDAPKIKKVIDPDGLLQIEVMPASDALVSIKVQVQADRWDALNEAAQRRSHELIVMTDDKDEPKLTLHYRVAPASAAKVHRANIAGTIDPQAGTVPPKPQ